jgi:energy-converting hydrogenase Eha subunit A
MKWIGLFAVILALGVYLFGGQRFVSIAWADITGKAPLSPIKRATTRSIFYVIPAALFGYVAAVANVMHDASIYWNATAAITGAVSAVLFALILYEWVRYDRVRKPRARK